MTNTINFTCLSDGQLYTATFEKPIGQSPNRCNITLNGSTIGEATWHKEDGLLDRFPEGEPVLAWDEICNHIEQDIEWIFKQ